MHHFCLPVKKKNTTTSASTEEMTLLHCTYTIQSHPSPAHQHSTPETGPVAALLLFFLRHRKCAQCIINIVLPWFHCVLCASNTLTILSHLTVRDHWIEGKAINLGRVRGTLLELHNVCSYATSTDIVCYFNASFAVYCLSSI